MADRSLRKLSILLPVILAAIIYIAATTSRGVIDYDEGYYAQAAKNMAESGNWVTPYVNGVRFLEKPPFLYWLTAGSFKIWGINEFALRLPTALGITALVWILALTARHLGGERMALIAGISVAFTAGTFLFTRETLHDLWLVVFIALAMYAFVRWYLDPRHPRKPALLFYAATAGAVMCKSLIGIAFPAGIVIVFFLISRERPRWRTLHLLPGILLFLALTVPWHLFAAAQNAGFLKFFFVGEQFLRFFGKREPAVLWSLSVPAFWALTLVWLFPWTAFLPAALAESRKTEQRVLVRLAFAWAGVIIGFFSVSGRLEHYVFPALPALSLLIAGTLSRSESKWVLWAFRGLAVFGILALLVGGGAVIWFGAHGFQFASSGPTDRLSENDFSILADMPADVMSGLLKPAGVTVVVMGIGFAAALWFEVHRRRMFAVGCVAAVMIVVFMAAHWSLNICEDLISSKKFAAFIAAQARVGDRLVVMGDYESANSLNFYEPLPVEICDGIAYALIPGLKYPDSPDILMTKQEFQSVWASNRRTFVLIPKDKAKELSPGGIELISILHRVLVKNH